MSTRSLLHWCARAALLPLLFAAMPGSGSVVIRDVAVVDVRSGRTLPGRTVSVVDGRISSILDAATSPTPPSEATLVDGRGKYLAPGFIDMHAHLNNNLQARERVRMLSLSDEDILSARHLAIFLYNGVTTLQVMHGDEHILALRDAIERGEVIGPRLIVGSPRLDGNPPSSPYPRIVATAAEGVAVVDEMRAAGFDFIKVYDRLNQPTYDAIVTRAHSLHLRVDGHLPRTLPLAHALDGRQDHVTHMEEFVGYVGDGSDAGIERLAAQTKRSGVGVTPNLIVFENVVRSVLDLPAVLKREATAYADPLVYYSWQPKNNPYRTERFQAPALREALLRQLALLKKLTLAFHREGVPMVVGTDCNISGTVAGFSFHDELAELAGAGIPASDTIRMATSNAASVLRRDSELGGVESGKVADLVLLDANPLENVGNARRISGIVLRGRWLPMSELRRMLGESLASYRPLDRRLQLDVRRPQINPSAEPTH